MSGMREQDRFSIGVDLNFLFTPKVTPKAAATGNPRQVPSDRTGRFD
jgi:hypothetical protein